MAIKKSAGQRIGVTILAWVVAFLIFFPILWTFLTSFKSELDAIAMPPKFLFFNWTLENYADVQQRSNYLKFAFNSVVLSIGANLVGLLIAVPAGKAHQRSLDVDAVDQDDASRWRAGADLPPVQELGSA
jgi:sorbitol/mannitol transport system permease protein